MRYERGSIKLNPDRDVAALRRVFRSEFITHEQLFELTQLELSERNRNVFNWRLRRLVTHGLIGSQPSPITNGSPLYSITALGLEVLTEHGEITSIALEQLDGCKRLHEGRTYHALGLNEIHIALRRSKCLLRWIPGTEVQAQNEMTRIGYAKDYDAVVYLRYGESVTAFALEYERTRKTEQRYREIVSLFERDHMVHHLVYVLANDHLRTLVRNCMARAKRNIILVLEKDLKAQVMESPAEAVGVSPIRDRLAELLCRKALL